MCLIEVIEGKAVDVDDRPHDLLMVIETRAYPQKFECPDCGCLAVWAEDRYAPGHRICDDCGSHYECFPCGDVPDTWLPEQGNRIRYEIRRARLQDMSRR